MVEMNSQYSDLVKVAWLMFMLGDLPRLLFSLNKVIVSKQYSVTHRLKKYSVIRIMLQHFAQNLFYMISVALLYIVCLHLALLLLFVGLLFLNIYRIIYQVKLGTPYVITAHGRNFNDYIMKPYRLIILIIAFMIIREPVWLIGFGIYFVKWLLITFYDRNFDVPVYFHFLTVIISAAIVTFLFFLSVFSLGNINHDALQGYFSVIATIYTAFIGFLGVLYQIILSSDKEDVRLKGYVTNGLILNYFFGSFLVFFSLISILLTSIIHDAQNWGYCIPKISLASVLRS